MRGCKRTDGRGWQCRRPVMDGKEYCETHFLQYCHRLKNEPVPAALKLPGIRRNKLLPIVEEEESSVQLDGKYEAPRRRGRKRNGSLKNVDEVVDSGLSRKRGRPTTKEPEDIVEISDQLDGGSKLTFQDGNLHLYKIKQDYETSVVKDIMSSPMSPQSRTVKREASSKMKVGRPSATKVGRRTMRSKNVESGPIATVKMLRSAKAKAKVKASAKKKIIKRCHWCKYTSYRVFVRCSTCKKQFFCQECIDKRFYCKTAIKRECPVCEGTCECRACSREKLKEVKEKELVIYDCDEEMLICNNEDEVAVSIPEKEVVVYNREKKFDKNQHLHMIRLLLPVMEKINQEKINELDIEAENKGKTLAQLQVQLTEFSKKPECSFCSSWVTDVHRSCESCSYILCIHCCNEFREGYLHSGLGDLKNTRLVRSKSRKISWKFSTDGNIRCPPQSLGGCGQDFLGLTSFSPFGFTKDLEANAKEIVCKYKFKKSFGDVSSPCLLCDENDELGSEKVGNLVKNKGLYFKTKQDLIDKNLKHFMKHWGNGQPLVIRDVLSQQDLNWDFGYLLCKYLERSGGKSEGGFDWCDVQFGRKQIFMGGKTHANVWQELLRFKVMFSSGFFEEKFPDHYVAVMEALPVKEYITGFMNLAMNDSCETGNPNFGPRVCISYGEPNLTDTDLVTKLCCHAYDMVNILVHATDHPISESKLNEVKILMNKYSSQDHIMTSKKIRTRKKLEKLFETSSTSEDSNSDELDMSSDDSSSNDSDDESFVYSQHEIGSSSLLEEEQVVDIDTHGVEWDIFHQKDVPKILEYLRKYSDKLGKSCGSPKKVVHPLFDEVFYLDELHKLRIKEEFNVEPWSFEQKIGEAVIIPAGCPYQMKKLKSCVNVVLDFISPESANNCIKVGDELRRLPVNHKAKKSMPKVKNMVINGMHTAIEEIRTVSET
ncbi:hypothetical protein L2E82_15173 [Cichorium intybus]|uniref:Uncharacterized protein n=1 Tax=Cichorium intybus TaxID=13427 RepID=A0ACB9F3C4_CICIN|nr:hypothetical protein L2E82_15173 [Cichorium intybus]